jgi:Zn-dependent peptidase ImmA (M78 family)
MIEIAYPSYASGEPRPMKAGAIRGLAAELRSQLFAASTKQIEVAQLTRRAGRMKVNGREVQIIWDIAHQVHDDEGVPVLGVCEHDPQEPRAVMISINADLANEPELLRSTAAHELGHAVFDMPAAMGAGARRTFRTRRDSDSTSVPIEWREWRADEFMGAFLTPKRQLARSLAREASAHGVALRWRVSEDIPTPTIAANEMNRCILGAIAGALAEEFGVSESFISVRFRKYGLVC